ncbi:LRR domain containing protein [Parasponia andersonii]|uniref:LRR domain containing protein n=1 Tax=Parasponia andersonii TaxID=3476 RepID=A0A2P5AZY8_PARAD|nr:LRR domain containing protein [Parasponia andersonii]
MYLLPYDENTVAASDAACWLDFSSCTATLISTTKPQQFSYSERLVISDSIDAVESEIGLFDPFARSLRFHHRSQNFSQLQKCHICRIAKFSGQGELPDCWSHFKRLETLILNNNNLSGKFPSSIGSLPRIQVLNLGNNNLTGELPSSLKKCTELTVLYVGENRLQGPVPSSIKKNVSLKRSRYTLVDSNDNDKSITLPYNGSIRGYDAQVGLIWKGRLSQYKSTLRLVKSIDLSSNKLTGEIPTEITELIGLVSLYLSRNNLSGQIPRKIGQLKSLDALDLSRNHLYGKIPSSLSEVDRLNFLDL